MTPPKRHSRAADRPRILVVDDAETVRTFVAELLEEHGYQVDTAEDGRRALALLETGADPDLVILDVMMPGPDGLETLRQIRERYPAVPVVMLSVVGKASTIVQAMQLGAADFVNKPAVEQELVAVVERALEQGRIERARAGRAGAPGGDEPLWEGAALAKIRGLLGQIAETDVSVLIQGESGVGKEVVARAVHATSNRRQGPFVKVNCAALPGELLESELFGYEKGAFTGAHARKPGKFEMAHGGSIFLDEIGEMSPPAQAKLLHVLQDARFSRLGGNEEVRVDVRVVSATNRPLDELTRQRRFREDLFFRLNVVQVRIPPLRERREEVGGLVDHFLDRFAARYRRPRPRPSPRLRGLLERYDFPGNVRELENMMKRIVVLGSEAPIVRDVMRAERAAARRGEGLRELLEEVEATAGELPLKEVGRRASLEAEREAISQVLLATDWNRKQAARMLGVSYKTLLQKIRECKIEPE